MIVAEGKATGITVPTAAAVAAAACTSCLAVVAAYRMPPPLLAAAAALLPSFLLSARAFLQFPVGFGGRRCCSGASGHFSARRTAAGGRGRWRGSDTGIVRRVCLPRGFPRVRHRRPSDRGVPSSLFLLLLSFAARALRFCTSGLSEPQYVGGGRSSAVGGEDRFKWRRAARWKSRVEGRRESE